jgi:N12 class adenine-specific DNA methylase
VHEFDAWASAFGDTSTELELQPSGAYKPVTRFAAFIKVADLMMMFRSVADVVQKSDLRGLLTLPRIRGGQRQLITADADDTASLRALLFHVSEIGGEGDRDLGLSDEKTN